ncbi:hypothetical protein LINPERPRIM_LOCUS26124, partial [Linum perenne]
LYPPFFFLHENPSSSSHLKTSTENHFPINQLITGTFSSSFSSSLLPNCPHPTRRLSAAAGALPLSGDDVGEGGHHRRHLPVASVRRPWRIKLELVEMGRIKIVLGIRKGDKTSSSSSSSSSAAALFDILMIAAVGRRSGGRGKILITTAAAASALLVRHL